MLMAEPNLEALARPWMTGFDAMFDEVFFNGTRDYKVARDSIGIFVCRGETEWLKGDPGVSMCGYSHEYIKERVFGLDPRKQHELSIGMPEALYMQGAFAAAQALELENV